MFYFGRGVQRIQTSPYGGKGNVSPFPLNPSRPTFRWIIKHVSKKKKDARRLADQQDLKEVMLVFVKRFGVAAESRCPPLQESVRNLDTDVCGVTPDRDSLVSPALHLTALSTLCSRHKIG
jgi:hypothetical protein